ncbi:TPA: hypothetical protein TZR28_001534 [Streptococcus suis]|nr:hypothetical protein [Streptococcus suis]HEL2693737.1 hypothetical protein [Streptococcus suis]
MFIHKKCNIIALEMGGILVKVQVLQKPLKKGMQQENSYMPFSSYR